MADVLGIFSSAGNNLIGISDGGAGFTDSVNNDQVGTANEPIDTRLGVLRNNGGATATHALLQGSPAIDKGNTGGAPVTDQRGVARPRDGDGNGSKITDIGAFER